uniref:Cell wall protein Cwp1p n=1 Tax=Pichia angusta TaxID=870730 RepID=Q2V055_PICAN|nr:cell wall protein Cwp1p [Ogataea angusta]
MSWLTLLVTPAVLLPFYSALYEKTAAAQSSQYSSSPAAVSSRSSAAASSSAKIATYEGAAAENVAKVGMGALLSGMAVLLM